MANSEIIGAPEDDELVDKILDDMEKYRRTHGMTDLEQSHRSRFFRKERNLDDEVEYP